MKRAFQGVFAALLAFKARPYFRYQASSEAASKLALELSSTVGSEARDYVASNRSAPPTLVVR